VDCNSGSFSDGVKAIFILALSSLRTFWGLIFCSFKVDYLSIFELTIISSASIPSSPFLSVMLINDYALKYDGPFGSPPPAGVLESLLMARIFLPVPSFFLSSLFFDSTPFSRS